MKLLLGPFSDGKYLKSEYHLACKNAKELYIASAYLTNWALKESLASTCEKFLFLVGTDFGFLPLWPPIVRF